jgi:heptosyltransferase-2
MCKQLLAAGIDFTRPRFVFAISARMDYKKWRLDYVRNVGQFCLDNYNAQIVLYAGSDTELEDVKEFQLSMNSNPDIHYLATTDLADLAALISHCNIFIGNESGPRHIAQALGLPSVSVFAPFSKKAEWLPNQSDRHVGVEWNDVLQLNERQKAEIEDRLAVGSPEYLDLYNTIKPHFVIDRIQQVVAASDIR